VRERASVRPAPVEASGFSVAAIGALAVLAPPVGMALLWTDARFSRSARCAVTAAAGATLALGGLGLALLLLLVR
jgi:hypothetical protein